LRSAKRSAVNESAKLKASGADNVNDSRAHAEPAAHVGPSKALGYDDAHDDPGGAARSDDSGDQTYTPGSLEHRSKRLADEESVPQRAAAKRARPTKERPTACPACGRAETPNQPLADVGEGYRCRKPGHCARAYRRVKSLLLIEKPLGKKFGPGNKRHYGTSLNERIQERLREDPGFFDSPAWASERLSSQEKVQALVGEPVEEWLDKCEKVGPGRGGGRRARTGS